MTAVVAWAYLIGSPGMPGAMAMDGAGMAGMHMGWTWREGLFLFTMWAVMMVAMMLPSAATMILLFSKIGVTRSAGGGEPISVASFVVGYLLVWWAFSAIAAGVQWQLHHAAVLSADMRLPDPIGGAVLIAAGIYQWLPIKESCLRFCRTPFGFLSRSWKEGHWGALVMGLTHGAFCLGCCWLLMALLFVAGVMNLAFVAAISAVVLMEKVLPAGPAVGRAAGILLIGAGIVLLV